LSLSTSSKNSVNSKRNYLKKARQKISTIGGNSISSINSVNMENSNPDGAIPEFKKESRFKNFRRSLKRSMEISRIPSMRKNKYCISTVATQADLDKGSITVERKETKYRNQEFSDVESQILSIELDVCSEAYASIHDWASLKKRNYQFSSIKNINNGNNNDKLITTTTTTRKELASVSVNDYVAFRNCVNYELNCINGDRNSVLYNGNDYALKLPPQEKVVVKFSSTMKPSQIENNFAEKLEIFEVNINEIKNFEPKLNTNEINHEYSQCKIKENNSESGTIQSKSCNISKDTETTLLDDTKLTSSTNESGVESDKLSEISEVDEILRKHYSTEKFDYYSEIITKANKQSKKRLRSGSVKACVETGGKLFLSSPSSEYGFRNVNGMSMPTFSINETSEASSEQNSSESSSEKDFKEDSSSDSNVTKSVRFSDDISFI
jgi:hypothetical protein